MWSHLLRSQGRHSIILLGLDLLSCSTWEGAKLQIGEAKPDFSERCIRAPASSTSGAIVDFFVIVFRLAKEQQATIDENPQGNENALEVYKRKTCRI